DPPDGDRFADDVAARRADGQPRRRVRRRPGGGAGQVRGHGGGGHPRPVVHAAARPVPVLQRGRHGHRVARVALRRGRPVNAEAVAFEGATVRVDGRTILGPVDLCVRTGQRWVFLGPNGSGKTTLLSL